MRILNALRGSRTIRISQYGIMAIMALSFIVHFTVTAIYLTPLNPVKLRLYQHLQAWIHPLFPQNWHLFAPDPVSSSHSLVTKCRSGTIESEWIDVTNAVLDRYYENRLSTAKAIGGIQINAIMTVTRGGMPISEPDVSSFCLDRDQDHPFCEYLVEIARIGFERSQRILIDMAADGCEKAMRNAQIDEVFIRITDIVFPRYSERTKPDKDGQAFVYDFGWHAPNR